MYIPNHFSVADGEEVDRFIERNGFGQLISTAANELFATHLPLLYQRDEKNCWDTSRAPIPSGRTWTGRRCW